MFLSLEPLHEVRNNYAGITAAGIAFFISTHLKIAVEWNKDLLCHQTHVWLFFVVYLAAALLIACPGRTCCDLTSSVGKGNRVERMGKVRGLWVVAGTCTRVLKSDRASGLSAVEHTFCCSVKSL